MYNRDNEPKEYRKRESLDTKRKYSVTSTKNRSEFANSKEFFKLRSGIRKVTKQVSGCGIQILDKNATVNIVIGKKGNTYFSNLATCGCVWLCPFCSLKIAEQRQIEVFKTLGVAHKKGHNAFFSTFTLRHNKETFLSTSIKTLKKGWTMATSSSKYQGSKKRVGLKQKYGIRGFIKSLEFTYGENGWHPHYHVVFFGNEIIEELQKFNDEFFELYAKCVRKLGGYVSRKTNAFRPVYSSKNISDYITKWNLSLELTKKNIKEGKGLNPFNLFMLYMDDPKKNEFFLNLWLEYAKAVKGSKFIQYSNELKLLYEVTEKNESDITKDDEIEEVLFRLDSKIWKEICKKECQSELIEYAKSNIPVELIFQRFNIPFKQTFAGTYAMQWS